MVNCFLVASCASSGVLRLVFHQSSTQELYLTYSRSLLFLLATIVYIPIPSTKAKTGGSKSEMIAYALSIFLVSVLNIYLFYQVYRLKKFTNLKWRKFFPMNWLTLDSFYYFPAVTDTYIIWCNTTTKPTMYFIIRSLFLTSQSLKHLIFGIVSILLSISLF